MIVSFLFVLLVQVGATSSPAKGEKKGPLIHFAAIKFDYGFLPPGNPVELTHKFVFSNSGDQPLLITRTGQACRTTAECENANIEPGKSSHISVRVILPQDYASGNFQRTIRIECNDPHQPIVELELRAVFGYTMDWKPSKIDLGLFSPKRKNLQSIRLRSLVDIPFKISSCSTNFGLFDVFIESKSSINPRSNLFPKAKDPTEYFQKQIILSIKPDAPIGCFFDALVIKTDRKDIPVITIPISGEIIGGALVKPSKIFLGIIRSANLVEKDIELISNDPGTKIMKANCNIKNLTISIQDNGHRVHLALAPHRLDGPLEGELLLETNLPHSKIFKVNIQGLIKIMGK